jgi:GNAT superfamily N-acetyltransferase
MNGFNEVTFRPAVLADAGEAASVYLASRHELVAFAPLAHTDDEVRGWIRDYLIPTGGVTVALWEGKAVGMMALSREAEVGWIDHLYLLPSAVGHGIGARFVERAKTEIGPPIRLYTFQANEGARRFYERHGFQAIELGDGTGNEEGVPDVLYEWTGRA